MSTPLKQPLCHGAPQLMMTSVLVSLRLGLPSDTLQKAYGVSEASNLLPRSLSTEQLYILLYGAEVRTPYHRHIVKLESFHLRCLREISGIKWQDKIGTQKCSLGVA